MTYCVGLLLDEGIVFASDSRTHAGVDNFARFCKLTLFERAGERVLVLLSSGNLAGTQAVIGLLKQRGDAKPDTAGDAPTIWTCRTMFDMAGHVGDAVRDIERRDGPSLSQNAIKFNASFILGGQIAGEPMRLFRVYAEGNFVEAGRETPCIQTGETKDGKSIIDRVVTPATSLADATKCTLVSFDSTMRSNLSVGMPIDLICDERDSLAVTLRRRLKEGEACLAELNRAWREGTRVVFRQLPALPW